MELVPESNSSQKNIICEDKYKIFEELNQAVSIIGTNGLLLYSNSEFEKLFKIDSETRLDLQHPFYPEYRKKIAKAYIGALNGTTKHCFAVLRTKDEERKSSEIYLFPLFENGEVTSILSTIQLVENRLLSFDDSTNLLISEEDAIYDKLYYEMSPTLHLRLHISEKIANCSQSLEGYLGYSIKDIIKKEKYDLKTIFNKDYDRIKSSLKSITNQEIPFKRVTNVKIFTKGNNIKFANLTIFPIKINKEMHFNEIVIEDITKINRLEEQISKINRVQLFSDISEGFIHSLNNNLNVILSQTQMLRQITEKEIVADGIVSIEKSANELVEQIHRIQNYINKKSSSNEIRKEPIVKIVEDAIEFAKMQFKVEDTKYKKSISIEKKYFSSISVETNTDLLREIIISIILKVSKYITKKGTIKVILKENTNLNLEIRVEKNKDSDLIPVSPDIVNIFSGSKIRETANKIDLKILEGESSEYFSINAIIPEKIIVKKEQTKTNNNKIKLRDLDIMVVEDEKPLQKILFELFDKMGNRVFITDNGKEALQEFKKKNYDIILTDYDIKGITGIELAARIKELNENVPMILLSGWSLGDLDSYENFIDKFFPKPFKLEDLITGMSSVLAEKTVK